MKISALTWIVGILALAAAITLVPLWVPLVLAAWSAHLTGGIARRLTRIVGNRRPVAAAITIGLLLVVLVPFARWGNLELPVFIQIISIFGGFIIFGAWGFLAGPLIFRLAKEALDIQHEGRQPTIAM